jgi:hypothetical protein
MTKFITTISHAPPALSVSAGMIGIIAVVAVGLPLLAFAAPGAIAGWGVYSLYHKH